MSGAAWAAVGVGGAFVVGTGIALWFILRRPMFVAITGSSPSSSPQTATTASGKAQNHFKRPGFAGRAAARAARRRHAA